MRKLFVIFAFIAIGAPLFAAVATPEQLKTYQERIANAKNDLQRADAQANIDVYGGDDPQSFAEIVTRVKAAFAKHNYTNDRYAVQKACQLACWGYEGKFVADAFKAAKADNNMFVYYLARSHKAALGLSDEESFDIYADVLLQHRFADAARTKQVLDALLRLAPVQDETKAKTVLKKLNRLYSPNLLKDKAAWEPVVATIRTALETY